MRPGKIRMGSDWVPGNNRMGSSFAKDANPRRVRGMCVVPRRKRRMEESGFVDFTCDGLIK